MKRKGFRGVIGIAALLYLVFTQVAYGQVTKGDFAVSGGTSSFADNVLTVSGGEVTVSTSTVTSQTIKLTGGKLILDGVQITVNSGNVSPIEVENIAEIHLASGSENTLVSNTADAAGIHVPPSSQVTFTGDGKLTAENTERNATMSASSGIGGKQRYYSCGTIIFDLTGFGSVTAKGGVRAAGIGTCMQQSTLSKINGTILIKKGTINAIAGSMAAGIGTGPDGGSDGRVSVTIEGGTVTASHIGNGPANATVDIFLLGGTVDANILVQSNKSPNTIIIGPDVIMTDGKTVSKDYTNGFVFSGSPKTATVKGNPVLPVDKEITINEGETLDIPSGTTLINNGKIISEGVIKGDGIIQGNQPQDKNGNTLYKVSYDLNGGKGTKPTSLYLEKGTLALPSYSGLTRDGYTCLGWNTTNTATTALTNYTVMSGENTLYAVWVKNIELTSKRKEITGTVGEVFTEIDLSENVSNSSDIGGVIFKVKEGSVLPEGFSLAEDGKLTDPDPLTMSMSNNEVLVTVTPGNGTSAAELTLTFNIAKGKLIVTPVSGQTIYADEYPAYTLPEYITEVELLTGNLSVIAGMIKKGNLTLTAKGQKDYDEIILSADNIGIIQKSEKAADAVVEIVPSGSGINQAGWYKNPVTLNAPVGFKVWVESIYKTKAAPTLRDTYRLTEDGLYTGYKLVRTITNVEYSHEIDIKLDQTAPELKGTPAISSHKAIFTLSDALSGIASYSYDLDGAGPSEMITVEGAPNEYEVEVMTAVGSHTISFTIWDVAGNMVTSALVDFTLPLPTVTLPDVEGATLSPLAGSHEVKPQGSFRFYLTLDEGYRGKSQPVVTTHLGDTIRPRQSDGAYVIYDISQDLVISISGIVPDVSTGIADINNATHIRAVDGTLLITIPQPANAIITDTSGRILRTLQLTPGTTRVEGLHTGIYIVKISGQQGRKVIVK